MKFRLSEVDIHWSGTDATTPPGHCIASGVDTFGNLRVWLFKDAEPSDDGYRGNVLLPKAAESVAIAYGPTGAYVKSGYDQTALLKQLANDARSDA